MVRAVRGRGEFEPQPGSVCSQGCALPAAGARWAPAVLLHSLQRAQTPGKAAVNPELMTGVLSFLHLEVFAPSKGGWSPVLPRTAPLQDQVSDVELQDALDSCQADTRLPGTTPVLLHVL